MRCPQLILHKISTVSLKNLTQSVPLFYKRKDFKYAIKNVIELILFLCQIIVTTCYLLEVFREKIAVKYLKKSMDQNWEWKILSSLALENSVKFSPSTQTFWSYLIAGKKSIICEKSGWSSHSFAFRGIEVVSISETLAVVKSIFYFFCTQFFFFYYLRSKHSVDVPDNKKIEVFKRHCC